MMTPAPEEAEYTIASVSKLTGISCHALRVWERRYGFPRPRRSPSGHRRYGRDQVRVLRRVSELAQQGRSIGDLIAEFQAGRLPLEADRAAEDADTVGRAITLLASGEQAAGEACFDRLARGLAPVELVTRVIGPALVDTGERWFRRELEIHQERHVSGFLRRKLADLVEDAHRANRRRAPTIVIGTVQGDRHEGGVLMLHLLLEFEGWDVVNLGVDLPVREYRKAVESRRADALGLSFVLSRNIKKRFQELAQLRGVPVFVGGRSILNYQGMARRHGLIPLPGPLSTAVGQLRSEFEAWKKSAESPDRAV